MYHDGFVFDIHAVADGIDAVDEFQRMAVEHFRRLVEMDDVEIRRQFDAQRLVEVAEGFAQNPLGRFKIVGDLRLAGDIRA